MKSYKLRDRLHENLLDDLLLARGIEGEEAKQSFLEPKFDRDSHDPNLLPDMEKAVDRIISAAKNSEKVCVWSDYDCDGIPGGVMLTQFLRAIGLKVVHYIPHRHKEGYGMNTEGIDELKEKNVSLIITIDLGTTEHERIAYAKQKGIETIVTDHHEVQNFSSDLPALAFINPKRPDSVYPFDGLCGAGVAWKLIQGVLKKNRFGIPDGHEKWFLDLVGLATLSDMVPLVGENRMLSYFGITVLRRNRRPGLAALLKILKISPASLTEDDIGFMVSPRINAASRMDSPEIAANLLRSADEEEAQVLARELNHINDARKGLVAATVKEANKRLLDIGSEAGVIVMGNPKWRPGILGLVASKIAEAHKKPVFLWGREGGETLKGSCRAGDHVSVVDIMAGASDVFDHFGGHHGSGGFAVRDEKVHELSKRLNESYETLKLHGGATLETLLDRALPLSEVKFAMRALAKMAPFGIANEKPLFLFEQVRAGRVRMFGKESNHMDVSFEQGGESVSGISFFHEPDAFAKRIAPGENLNVVGHVELDWKGSPRIRIVDII